MVEKHYYSKMIREENLGRGYVIGKDNKGGNKAKIKKRRCPRSPSHSASDGGRGRKMPQLKEKLRPVRREGERHSGLKKEVNSAKRTGSGGRLPSANHEGGFQAKKHFA